MTIEDIKETYKVDLSRSLDALISDIYQRDNEVIPVDDTLITYEWGNGDANLDGVHTLIKQFYDELYLLTGSAVDTPSPYSQTEWTSRFDDALSIDGDGAGGLYPSGIDTAIVNTNSTLLLWNGYTPDSTGALIQKALSSVEDPVRVDPGTIDDGNYAINYVQITDPASTKYYISSNYYNALLSAFNSYISMMATYATNWAELLANSDNAFITLGSSLVNIDSSLATFLTTAQNYMDSVTTEYNAAPSNTTTLSDYDDYQSSLDTLRSYLINRRDSVEAFFTTDITTDPVQTLRTLRSFLTIARVSRLNGTYAKRLGAEDAVTSSEAVVVEASSVLEQIEQDADQWIAKPSIITGYYEEVQGVQRETLRTENNLILKIPGHTTTINIYRKSVLQSAELDNTEWEDDVYETITTRDVASNYIEAMWMENIIPADRGHFYLYRIQCEDTGAALPSEMVAELYPVGTIKSKQSDIIGSSVSFKKTKDLEIPNQGWATSFSGDVEALHTFKGGFVYIENRGIHLVVRKTIDEIVLFPAHYSAPTSGSDATFILHPIQGIINAYDLTS